MRIIVNLNSDSLVKTAGWRAKAIKVNDHDRSNMDESFRSVVFEKGKTLHDIVFNDFKINNRFVVYINGIQVPEQPDFNMIVRDNVQIHVIEKPSKEQ